MDQEFKYQILLIFLFFDICQPHIESSKVWWHPSLTAGRVPLQPDVPMMTVPRPTNGYRMCGGRRVHWTRSSCVASVRVSIVHFWQETCCLALSGIVWVKCRGPELLQPEWVIVSGMSSWIRQHQPSNHSTHRLGRITDHHGSQGRGSSSSHP